jgi:hypothetical protein
VEQALRMSRAGRCPIGIVAHVRLLRMLDTLETRPNRVLSTMDAVLARRRRRRGPRFAETGGALRMARRLELNLARAMPSPGERVAIGFITVGPADAALAHIVHVLELTGRVPVLQLGLIHPVDESSLERLLCRCEQALVLEPRPGSMESAVLAVAEALRRRGARPASIWGLTVPAPDGTHLSMQRDEALEPSLLVRRIVHLLLSVRPTLQVAMQLAADPPPATAPIPPRGEEVGPAAETAALRRLLADVDQSVRDAAAMRERGSAVSALALDGVDPPGFSGRVVVVELWMTARFMLEGAGAIAAAAAGERPAMLLVGGLGSGDSQELERLARGMTPGERADRVRIEIGNLADPAALRERMLAAALADLVTVLLVRDGPPARFDVDSIERGLAEIDRLGYQPLQRIVQPTELACTLEPEAGEELSALRGREVAAVRSALSVHDLPERFGGQVRLRIRPLVEQVEVVRTRAPAAPWRRPEAARLPLPQPVHGRQALWRAHVAGYRGRSSDSARGSSRAQGPGPGALATAMAEAGRTMGYHVRTLHDPAPIAGGRRAWAQVLFTRPREGEPPLPLLPGIPYGEADLLLGVDPAESLRALAGGGVLRIGHPQRTGAVVNVGEGGEAWNPGGELDGALRQAAAASTRPDQRCLAGFSAACRAWFHSDRVADMAIAGAAFQMGLIPVSLEAMRAALGRLEDRGLARSLEAFEFGRHAAVEPRLLSMPQRLRSEALPRLIRRAALGLARERPGGRWRAPRLRGLIERSLEAMPGLTESEAGREARLAFARAVHRCFVWGGAAHAERFAQLITRLYQADRAETARALTRAAIPPLAEVMLIRDPIYIASMTISAEHQMRLRRELNVHPARGDRMERRYITRFELVALRRLVRFDARTSDWLARLAALARGVWPGRWRGSARERQVRSWVIEIIERASLTAPGAPDTPAPSSPASPGEYDRWRAALERLQAQTIDDRLRGMTLPELRMLIEPEALPREAPAG